MITIANPIYDTVFKYLMEDERIARTILSALLKEEILRVEVRPHEYSNGQKESLSIFRIDRSFHTCRRLYSLARPACQC